VTAPRRTCWLAVVALVLAASLAVGDVASAKVSKGSAERAAYRLAKKLGQQSGAVLWAAGHCKRKGANHVVCWGAVVYPDYEGCAQQVSVRRSGGKLSARRVGRRYCGDVSDEAEQNSGSGSGDWAICGIRQSVCIGS
jgi:hypothetical protein